MTKIEFFSARGLLALALFLCWLGSAPLAWAQEPPAASVPRTVLSSQPRFTLSLTGWETLATEGTVSVRENHIQGTNFNLAGDLGMKNWTGIQAEADLRVSSRDLLRASYTRCLLQGRDRLAQDSYYNGSRLLSGSDVTVGASTYWRGLFLWQQTLWDSGRGSAVDLLAGGGFDYLDFHADAKIGTRSGKRGGSEAQEDFYAQEPPYPVLGVRLERVFRPRTSIFFETYGTYLPRFKTWHTEGGPVSVTQTDLDALLGVKRRWGKAAVPLGAGYKYFAMDEESHEDGNKIQISGPGLFLTLEGGIK